MNIDLSTPVTALMKRPVKKLQMNATVRDAAEFLLNARISGAPVIDTKAEPVGVFSLTDLARHMQTRMLNLPEVEPRRERVRGTGEPVPLGHGFHFEGFEQVTVSDLMTPGIVSVPPRATVAEAVQIMATTGLHRVFVMKDPLSIDGVVTTMDVLKWIRTGMKARPARSAAH